MIKRFVMRGTGTAVYTACLFLVSCPLTGAVLAGEADAPPDKDPPEANPSRLHLFILSGQSNMVGLNSQKSFVPSVKKAFPNDERLVVKLAFNGRPIRDWYKKHKRYDGKLYDRLMRRVKARLGNRKPDTVTFVWMQGESDAKKRGKEYAECLAGLIAQVRTDLGRKDVNFVVGRISDFSSPTYPQWDLVREALVKVAEADARGAWVDTDDLNGPKNALHYTRGGSSTLGRRFAEYSIKLIKKNGKAKR